MRLSELPRTTSFRLALLFAALFGAASSLVFAFLYWQTAGFLTSGVDDWLIRETVGRAAAAPAARARALNARAGTDPEGRRPFALFDGAGNWIAGAAATLPTPLPPLDVPFEFTLPRRGEMVPFRGLAHQLPSGEIMLSAQDSNGSSTAIWPSVCRPTEMPATSIAWSM